MIPVTLDKQLLSSHVDGLCPPLTMARRARVVSVSFSLWGARDIWVSRAASVELVELLHAVQDRLLRRLLHLAREEELVQDHVDLVKVEDKVELAHVPEELVEELDEEVDRLEVEQLIVVHVHAQREKEPGVPPVDELVLGVLQSGKTRITVSGSVQERGAVGGVRERWGPTHLDKVGELRVARRHNAVHVRLNFVPLLIRVCTIILAEAGLALPVLQEKVLDHGASQVLAPRCEPAPTLRVRRVLKSAARWQWVATGWGAADFSAPPPSNPWSQISRNAKATLNDNSGF